MSDAPTFRDTYEHLMHVHDQALADVLFEKLVLACMQRTGVVQAEAERIQRSNLGYYAGYFDHETRERVERLFACEHPYFGSIAKNGPPTAQQAWDMGVAHGELLRRREQEGGE